MKKTSETFYKPLTPELRIRIDNSVDGIIGELKTCEPNAYVNAQITAYEVLKKIIKGLPDGYPILLKGSNEK